MEKKFDYRDGEIREVYTLGHEEEFAVSFHHNTRVAGLELEGEVLERQNQQLQILLDIDVKRPSGGKTWFEYSPATNNGMYSMPLVGEKVILNWQSQVDHDVLILRPSRKNGSGLPHHGQRHFLDENSNHLMMIPGKVEYTNPVGNISWLESSGFDISTRRRFSIIAGQDILINSGSQVRVYSPRRITMLSGAGSSIDMAGGEINIQSATVVREVSTSRNAPSLPLPRLNLVRRIREAIAAKINGATAENDRVNVNFNPRTGAGVPGFDPRNPNFDPWTAERLLLEEKRSAQPMAISEAGREFLILLEGFKPIPTQILSEPYYTIGLGHYGIGIDSMRVGYPDPHFIFNGVRYDASNPMPQSTANQILAQDLARFERPVNLFMADNEIRLTQSQFDALVIDTYQRGANTWGNRNAPLQSFLLNGNLDSLEEAEAAFNSNPNSVHGVQNRRIIQAEFFVTESFTDIRGSR